MPAWIMAPLGAGSWNAVPGAVLVATPGTRPAGVLARWQLSHLVELGICEEAPGVAELGMTTILVTP